MTKSLRIPGGCYIIFRGEKRREFKTWRGHKHRPWLISHMSCEYAVIVFPYLLFRGEEKGKFKTWREHKHRPWSSISLFTVSGREEKGIQDSTRTQAATLASYIPIYRIGERREGTSTLGVDTSTDLGVLVVVRIPGGLHGGLVVALDLAGLGIERDASGGHGDLHAPLAAAGLGQLVSSAHSVQVLWMSNNTPYRSCGCQTPSRTGPVDVKQHSLQVMWMSNNTPYR